MKSIRKDIAGMVLAGGMSTRMQRNKALIIVDGVTFIQRIVQTLEQRFSRIYISANWADEYAFLNHPIIPDVYENGGPLAGIHAVMRSVKSDYIFTVTCDVPFISTNIIDAVIDKIEPGTILVADDGMRTHHLLGVYPRSMIKTIENYLERGDRRVARFLSEAPHKKIDVSQFAREVKNINTVVEYEREVGR